MQIQQQVNGEKFFQRSSSSVKLTLDFENNRDVKKNKRQCISENCQKNCHSSWIISISTKKTFFFNQIYFWTLEFVFGIRETECWWTVERVSISFSWIKIFVEFTHCRLICQERVKVLRVFFDRKMICSTHIQNKTVNSAQAFMEKQSSWITPSHTNLKLYNHYMMTMFLYCTGSYCTLILLHTAGRGGN